MKFPCGLLLLLVAFGRLSAQSTVFNDTFADGERITQAPPNSLAWYHNTTNPANMAVKNGALDILVANDVRTVWAYFPAATLAIGDTLTLTLEFSFTTQADFGLRIAMFDSNGVTPVRGDQRPGPQGNYLGYGIFEGGNNNRTAIYKRDGTFAPNPTSSLLDTFGDGTNTVWVSHNGSPTIGGPAAANTPFVGTMKITRTGASTMVVTSNFTGAGIGTASNVTFTDTTSIVTRFDTLAIDTISNAIAGDIIITRANLTQSSSATIAQQPVSRGVAVGAKALFTATAVGSPAPTYQWQRKAAGATSFANLPESGAYSGTTTSALLVTGVANNMSGDQFRVLASNSAVIATSDAATLTIVTPDLVGRITNLSILTGLATVTDQFTMGYTVGGEGTTGTKSLVIRAVGPSLGALGVQGTLDDPKMDFFANGNPSGGNDNWGGSATVASAMASVGAFALASPTSKDAAAVATVPAGGNSVIVSSSGGTGTVIAEIYDATPTASFGAATPRLINVSVLKPIGTSLTAGFFIGGSSAKPVLVRAIGPALTAFGVGGALVDPQLTLFDSTQAVIAQNDDWGGSAGLTAAFTQTGAFKLDATSKDAAIVVTLPPGGYTVRVTGAGGTTGTALVEVYELP